MNKDGFVCGTSLSRPRAPPSCGARVPCVGIKNVHEILPFGTQGDSQPLAQGKWYCWPVTEIYCHVASALSGMSGSEISKEGAPWGSEVPLPLGGAKGQ